MKVEDIRAQLLSNGFPKEILDEMSDEDLMEAVGTVEKLNKDKGVTETTLDNGTPAFRVSTPIFEISIPRDHMVSVMSVLSALRVTSLQLWDHVGQAERDIMNDREPNLLGAISDEFTDILKDYFQANPEVWEELQIGHDLSMRRRQVNDYMFG